MNSITTIAAIFVLLCCVDLKADVELVTIEPSWRVLYGQGGCFGIRKDDLSAMDLVAVPPGSGDGNT
ncbi:MAG: hypothetical protein QF473_33325, partial [Planctomycetota bacterium]|nr:hypothetical protein [Planctomycetota bacterium]